MIGSMRKRIVLQSLTTTEDGQGGLPKSWTAVQEIYANITSLSAWETMTYGQRYTGIMHKVTIRYRSDITPKHRFLWGSRILEIRQINNKDNRNKFLECVCEEIHIGTV